VAAKTAYTDTSDYTTATSLLLGAIEPSLTYNAAGVASTGPTVVSVAVTGGTSGIWSAAALSESGTCYWIMDDATAAGTGTKYDTGAVCTGTAAAGAAGTSW
jgi:type IV pilus assembly protein PilA